MLQAEAKARHPLAKQSLVVDLLKEEMKLSRCLIYAWALLAHPYNM